MLVCGVMKRERIISNKDEVYTERQKVLTECLGQESIKGSFWKERLDHSGRDREMGKRGRSVLRSNKTVIHRLKCKEPICRLFHR